MEAPLRKKSRDVPGSVLRLLIAHVMEQMDHQGSLVEVGPDHQSVTSGVKVMSYLNLFVKASYPHHLRELRELHHLASVIDLLRAGDLGRAADGLAARFIAVHQSVVDGGWSTARHL